MTRWPKRRAGRLLVDLGDQRLEPRLCAKAVPAQTLLARHHPVGQALVFGQLADEFEQQRAVLDRREAERDRRLAHRSRHSRRPLPGGPKSRGAMPEWNHVTKL